MNPLLRRPPALPLLFLVAAGLSAQTPPVHLTGAPNFRDIGGLQTSDGHTVKSGILFRSGQLSALTAADYAVLAPLGIRAVFDLRTDGERAGAPTHWTASPAPEFVPASLQFGSLPTNLPTADMMKQLAATLHTEDDARAMMTNGMAGLVDSGRSQLGGILARLASGSQPAIVHCTAGKDRTGLFTAILLSILGVPREQILRDYLRSNANLASGGALPPGTQLPLDPRIMKPMMTVEPGYLEASFRQIDANWGSFDEYRRKGLGLTDAQVTRLKALFLN